MAQINEIVSGYVGVTKTDADDDSKKFDISNIDFDRLRKEFEKAQNKNLMFKDLQDIVEERLLRMMKNNPLRINYYERYQEIVDEYNKENRMDEIAIVFVTL
jgi:type I restriction enzyme R subunit